ncbi:MAG: ABC transporter substrate-binding protein [bacterium]|nr:ABC transporter substrate-binding protein [bacterium]
MLRGFRWQFFAFIVAVVVFIAALLSRPSPQPAPPAATPQPTEVVQQVTDNSVIPTNAPEPTPADTTNANPQSPAQAATDNIPTYREALIGSVQRLNPLLAGLNPVDRDIISLIFEGLMRSNEYGEPQPALARSQPVISSDGLEYVLELRNDVLWQDGTPFTADDVVFTVSMLSAADFPGPEEVGRFWRTVEVEKISDTLVRFRLAQPLASFPEALQVGILPYHALQGTTAAQLASHPFNLTPVGTGPYQLEAMRGAGGQIQEISLRVAPVYRQRPEGQSGYAVERVMFRLYPNFEAVQQALTANEVDAYAVRERSERLPLLALPARFNTFTKIEPTVGFLIFNWANDTVAAFRDLQVRQALEIGLQRESIIERHLANQALPANSPLLEGSWAFNPNLTWPPYNPGEARNLLGRSDLEAVEVTPEATPESTAEATGASTGTPALLRFSILTPDEPSLVSVAQEIASQWAQLSVTVQVDAVDLNTYRTRLEAGDFQTALVELSKLGSADPDVYNFWHQGQYPDGDNYGGANDRTVSELLERGRREMNGTSRVTIYQQFQQQFVNRAVALPLYYPLYTFVVSQRISGVQLGFIASPPDRFRTIRDWVVSG